MLELETGFNDEWQSYCRQARQRGEKRIANFEIQLR